ncbi:hypothetical protein DFJ43DRAFT_1050579 [Lentinula guzmanii]|uniref:Uncharacterized protein n=1 Tax=Lentinula guzmanii TaxID=2804957 RepID=A0AA38JVB7_9AGAR|nr:hypothetical protein DFJ43DRAFT_1050579 [Lentinula guzmanii]
MSVEQHTIRSARESDIQSHSVFLLKGRKATFDHFLFLSRILLVSLFSINFSLHSLLVKEASLLPISVWPTEPYHQALRPYLLREIHHPIMRINLFMKYALMGFLSIALAIPLTIREHYHANALQIRGPNITENDAGDTTMARVLGSSGETAATSSVSLRLPDNAQNDRESKLLPRGKVTLKVSFDLGKKTIRPTAAQESTRGIVTRFLLDAMQSLVRNVEFNVEFENDWIGKNTEITFVVVGGQECSADESGVAGPGRRDIRRATKMMIGSTVSKRASSGCRGGVLDKSAKSWVLKNPTNSPIYGPVPRPRASGK